MAATSMSGFSGSRVQSAPAPRPVYSATQPAWRHGNAAEFARPARIRVHERGAGIEAAVDQRADRMVQSLRVTARCQDAHLQRHVLTSWFATAPWGAPRGAPRRGARERCDLVS